MPQIYLGISYVITLDLTLLVAMGLFYFKEIALINGIVGIIGFLYYIFFLEFYNLTEILQLAIVIFYNLMDSKKICEAELKAFFKIITLNRESTYMSKFVDRLLPKHVNRVYDFRSRK